MDVTVKKLLYLLKKVCRYEMLQAFCCALRTRDRQVLDIRFGRLLPVYVRDTLFKEMKQEVRNPIAHYIQIVV